MKLHVGADRRALVRSLTTTHAAAADIAQLPQLLHGAGMTLYGDKAYYTADDKLHCDKSGVRYVVDLSCGRTGYWDAINPCAGRADLQLGAAPLGARD